MNKHFLQVQLAKLNINTDVLLNLRAILTFQFFACLPIPINMQHSWREYQEKLIIERTPLIHILLNTFRAYQIITRSAVYFKGRQMIIAIMVCGGRQRRRRRTRHSLILF